jgi:hypothetical protein
MVGYSLKRYAIFIGKASPDEQAHACAGPMLRF